MIGNKEGVVKIRYTVIIIPITSDEHQFNQTYTQLTTFWHEPEKSHKKNESEGDYTNPKINYINQTYKSSFQ